MQQDKIKDWYGKMPRNLSKKFDVDKNYNKHMIKPCMQMGIIGPSGSGKTTSLLEFISRKRDWYDIIVFTGSTSDEPLYNFMKENIDGIQLIDNVDELPNLEDFNEDDKSTEKLMVFDDINNLDKKKLKIIEKWFNSSRKYGFTTICIGQSYTGIPISIRRNIMVWFIFRLKDVNEINQILKNHNTNNIAKETIKNMYHYAVKDKGNFFKIDFTNDENKMFSRNFIDFLLPSKFK